MPDTAPKLPSADPGTQPGYAPISWTAVAALGMAILFILVLAVMAWGAWDKKQALVQPQLLIFPALAVILAFVARRQITASEGTRTGLVYATAGWWVAVIGGLGYGAYLFAIDFSIGQQAEKEFTAWATRLKEADPANEKDPKFYEAAYLTLEPGTRVAVRSPSDTARMDQTFRDYIGAFRQTDVVRIVNRNKGAVEFRPQGLREWEQKPSEITCSLAATLITPEGDHLLILPMRAVVDVKTKERRWQIGPSSDGYVKVKTLTRYGHMVEHLENTGKAFAQDFMTKLSTPGGDTGMIGYLGYVHPDWDLRTGVQMYNSVVGTAPASGALFGAASFAYFPRPAGADEYLLTRFFARPDGSRPSDEDLAKFKYCWNNPGRISAAGSILRENYEVHPIVLIKDDRVEVRVPVELAIAGTQIAPSAAKARLILRPLPAQEAELLRDLKAAREAAGPTAERLPLPPEDVVSREIPWRIVRMESDMQLHVSQQAPPDTRMPSDGI